MNKDKSYLQMIRELMDKGFKDISFNRSDTGKYVATLKKADSGISLGFKLVELYQHHESKGDTLESTIEQAWVALCSG